MSILEGVLCVIALLLVLFSLRPILRAARTAKNVGHAVGQAVADGKRDASDSCPIIEADEMDDAQFMKGVGGSG